VPEPAASAPRDTAGWPFLDSLTNYEASGRPPAPTTDRIRQVLSALGDPQRAYPAVHVTGTNGKGSTSQMTARLLTAAGLRTGLYTSPHLHDVSERIRVQGTPIEQVAFEAALAEVQEACRRRSVTPTWFEALTATAFLAFARARVDVAVVEVGMLGRWDATNVIDAGVSVVTNVELDHTDFAGHTRAAIAAEKAGIIVEGATLVTGETDPDLLVLFEQRRPGRTLTLGIDMGYTRYRPVRDGSLVDLWSSSGRERDVLLGVPGKHQCANAALAIAAAQAHLQHPLAPYDMRDALKLSLPGRYDVVGQNPLVVVDVAHNPAAARALRRTLDARHGSAQPRILVCGMLRGHDPVGFLAAFAGSIDLLIATSAASARALPPAELAEIGHRLRIPVATEDDATVALAAARRHASPAGIVVVTGSHYLAGGVLAGCHQTEPKRVGT
jgi:dihydrofolate synthase/folylpolyglutamate synthase